MLENRVLRRIFGSRRDEVTGEWRKLYNEEIKRVMTKRRPLYLKPQSVPRCKHFSSRL
jgi:hypothetical protein